MEKRYYHTKESVSEYVEMAKDVSGIRLIEKLYNYLLPKSTLLEIGSGPGTDWNILKKDYDVFGSDYSIEFIKYLKEKYPDGKFMEIDAITIETDKKFDGIYSYKVLHHLNDQELTESIIRQYEVLNDKGIICHSFWKGEGSEVFKGMFVNYHSDKSLNELFGDKFEILLMESYQEFEANDSMFLIARKK